MKYWMVTYSWHRDSQGQAGFTFHNSVEAFSLLAKNALDQGVPVILPMDNSYHQNHKLACF